MNLLNIVGHEKLFLILLPLDSHVPVFILRHLRMGHRVAHALRVPGLAYLLTARLRSRSHWEQQGALSRACVEGLQLILAVNVETLAGF